MRKIEDYRQHAEECRAMIAIARTDEHRKMLGNMVETWETLAREREVQLARQARIEALKVPRPAAR